MQRKPHTIVVTVQMHDSHPPSFDRSQEMAQQIVKALPEGVRPIGVQVKTPAVR